MNARRDRVSKCFIDDRLSAVVALLEKLMLRKPTVDSLARLVVDQSVCVLEDSCRFHFLVGPSSPILVVAERPVIGVELPFNIHMAGIYGPPVPFPFSLEELAPAIRIQMGKAKGFNIRVGSVQC
jgi:hypothetical protein